jgi:hypothetical protein
VIEELFGVNRQKLIGWILIVVAGLYGVYFLKTRLLTAGPPIEKKEWIQFIGLIVLVMIGTINVRLAAMRQQKRKSGRAQ